MKKTILLMMIMLSAFACYANAEDNNTESQTEGKKWEVISYWASNWGATTSLGVPAETRKIKSSGLKYNYVFGTNITRMFKNKWGVSTGLRFERKANASEVEMKNFLTTVTLVGQGTPTHGYFSGTSKSVNDNIYLTVPVLGVRRLSDKWDARAGMYFSYAVKRSYTGEATDGKIRETPLVPATAVSYSTSDFSDDINKFDCGIQAGVVNHVWKNLCVTMDMNWGLVNTLDSPESGMTMNVYNLYLCVGLGWQF